MSRSWPEQVVVGTAVTMFVLCVTKVVFVGAIVFGVFALLYAVAAVLTGRGSTVGPWIALPPSVLLVVAEGQILLDLGVRPSAYSPASDFLIVVLGVPVALACGLAAGVLLVRARAGRSASINA